MPSLPLQRRESSTARKIDMSSVEQPYRYRTIPLTFIHNELAFDSLEAARTFLTDHSCAFFVDADIADNQKNINCKAAIPRLIQVYEEKYRKVGIKGAI